MKKLFYSALFTAAISIALVGCGGNDPNDPFNPSNPDPNPPPMEPGEPGNNFNPEPDNGIGDPDNGLGDPDNGLGDPDNGFGNNELPGVGDPNDPFGDPGLDPELNGQDNPGFNDPNHLDDPNPQSDQMIDPLVE